MKIMRKSLTECTLWSERHKAGGASFFPDMNNCGFIYHVTNEFGVKHLLLNGIPGPSCIP